MENSIIAVLDFLPVFLSTIVLILVLGYLIDRKMKMLVNLIVLALTLMILFLFNLPCYWNRCISFKDLAGFFTFHGSYHDYIPLGVMMDLVGIWIFATYMLWNRVRLGLISPKKGFLGFLLSLLIAPLGMISLFGIDLKRVDGLKVRGGLTKWLGILIFLVLETFIVSADIKLLPHVVEVVNVSHMLSTPTLAFGTLNTFAGYWWICAIAMAQYPTGFLKSKLGRIFLAIIAFFNTTLAVFLYVYFETKEERQQIE